MKTIPLTQGYVALIDDRDYKLVKKYKWHIAKDKWNIYAETTIINKNKKCPRQYSLRMHRLIMKARPGQKFDHHDHNGLNNQRYNLRKCTNPQNSFNRRKNIYGKPKLSKYKGVTIEKNKKSKWRAQIVCNHKHITIGRFLREIDAARAYDLAAMKYFRRFACVNFP